jgi:hypothetical protein
MACGVRPGGIVDFEHVAADDGAGRVDTRRVVVCKVARFARRCAERGPTPADTSDDVRVYDPSADMHLALVGRSVALCV